MSNPERVKATNTLEGPGIDSTLNPSLIIISTNLLPGSEIKGVPASEIRARFKLFPK